MALLLRCQGLIPRWQNDCNDRHAEKFAVDVETDIYAFILQAMEESGLTPFEILSRDLRGVS